MVRGPYEIVHYFLSLSTDTKPLASVGDELYETDTRLWYIYNGTTWSQKPSVSEEVYQTITNPATDAAVTRAIIDGYDGVIITLSAAGNAQTLASPTILTSGKRFSVYNNDTSGAYTVVVNGLTLAAGDGQLFVWDYTAWIPVASIYATAVSDGVVKLATGTESITGTDPLKVITPSTLTSKMTAPGTIGGTTPGVATFTTANATTFDTNVAAAGVTLAGTTLAADGTDAAIDINITPKGTGEVNIPKVDIDAGTIDGATIATSDITVGTGKTLTAIDGKITIPEGTPTNAKAASGTLTVTGTPLAAVPNTDATGTITITGTPLAAQANVYASGQLEVSGLPKVYVANADATGTLTVTGKPQIAVSNADATGTITITDTPVEDEHLTVGAQEFHFKTLRSGAGEITISADNTDQASNIVDAIALDLATVTSDHLLGAVTVTAVAHGTAGNALALTTDATGVAVSVGGTLLGGIDAVNADTFVVDSQTFTFVSAGTATGNVVVDVDTTNQAHNIITSINRDLATVTADHLLAVATITSAAHGTAGNAIDFTENSAALTISGTGHLAGGIDAVAADTFLVDAQTFTFVSAGTAAGNVVVDADSTNQAHNMVTSINRDIAATVTADHLLGVVSISANAAGTAGNAIDFTKNSAALAITGTGHFTGGIDAVPEEYFNLGTQKFTFVTSGTALGNVVINANNTTQAANIVTSVTRDLATVSVTNTIGVVNIVSVAHGVAGNSITLTENATGVAVSAGGTLQNGQDAVAEQFFMAGANKYVFVAAETAPLQVAISANNTTQAENIVAAITADDAVCNAANLAGVVTVSSKVLGTAGNSIALSASATGVAASASTLLNGTNGTVGLANETCADGTYLYHCLGTNSVTGQNWRRIALGTAY